MPSNMSKILIVEDDPGSRFMMQEMIEDLGYAVEVAENGQACIDALKGDASRYSVVLMDLHMPGQSGLEALQFIRALKANPPRDIPVVAVTADSAWHDAEKARRSGFSTVVPKPVSMSNIRDALQTFAA